MHLHPYPETWIVRSCSAKFTAGDSEFQALVGDILVVEANTPHRYRNSGDTDRELELAMDRWCPVAEAYILESGKVDFYTLRGFEMKELSRSGVQPEGRGDGRIFVASCQ